MILVVVSLLFTVVHATLDNRPTVKCCAKNEQIATVNGTVLCVDKTDARFDILTNSSEFLSKHSTGECVDIDRGHFYNYRVENGVITSNQTLSRKPFPKCCPLDHVYSPTTRSCINKTSIPTNLIIEDLVVIGLPKCQIILDKTLDASFTINRDSNQKDFCIDEDDKGSVMMRECQGDFDICQKKRCFKKCCPDGQSFVGGGVCKDTFVRGLQIKDQGYSPYIEDPEDDYEIVHGTGCTNVNIYSTNTLQYTITKNGSFRYYSNYTDEFVMEPVTDFTGYCLEHATKGSMSGYFLFRCFKQPEIEEKFAWTIGAKILSGILLIVTVLIYFYLGEVRNTFGKILINYCIAMFLLMVTLASSILAAAELECKIREFIKSPKKPICVAYKKKNLRRFVCYCLYGWGVAFCHMILLIILENTNFLPDLIQPRIGNLYCFIENVNYGRIVFLLIPYLAFQTANIVLFVKTAVYCIRVQNEINKMNDGLRRSESGRFVLAKDRLALILKLAVIMGLIWFTELLTTFFNNMESYSGFSKTLEIILDTITCSQGILIFIIFICKRKIFNMLKQKLGCGSLRDSSSPTPSSEVNGNIALTRGQTPVENAL
ncbi:hypothetical protein GWI33_014455 [Rhynchophorus ferrugineus]|uniref:Uncharacterized protein n=1 Tax=Rhynchophorus ferrugineus TaxID=354439 RepID=A0A834I525_RHYFE|nr:hypothetical protein GWI33_014455 [Rhynchophorus ferrugineus]